jgi:hypothetical protein
MNIWQDSNNQPKVNPCSGHAAESEKDGIKEWKEIYLCPYKPVLEGFTESLKANERNIKRD